MQNVMQALYLTRNARGLPASVRRYSGVRPFLSNKYDITKHPMYKYLSDYDEKNVFDIEKYLSTKLHPKPTEEYDLYEIDADSEKVAGS